MFFVVLDVHSGSRKDYLTKKIQAGVMNVLGEEILGSDFVDKQVSSLMSSDEIPAVSLMKEDEFYKINDKQEYMLDIAERCALTELVHTAPLIEGEEIAEDFFTYLKEPFNEFPKNTGVLKRRTNMAELLYIFDHVQIKDGTVTYREEKQPTAESGDVVGSSDKIGDIIKDLLSKAAGAAGGKIGALIFNLVIKEIFGKDDNKEFIEAIQKVVKDEIESNQIDKINGRIRGTIQFMTNEYQERKKDSNLSKKEDRKELLDLLSHYSQDFYTDVIGILEQPAYVQKGLKAFILGASIHLIITQEQALVDWKTMKPNESSYAATLKLNAKQYREHIETVFDKMVKTRLEKIKWYNSPDYACGRTGCHVTRDAWAWSDEETHEGEKIYNDMHKKGPSAKELAEQAASNKKTKVLNKMTEDAGDPKSNAIPSLKKLETNKIPT